MKLAWNIVRSLSSNGAWPYLRVLLHSYSEIFFLQSTLIGGLLLAITLVNPHVGVSGLLSVVSAYAFARLINVETTFLTSGFYTYNALLVGLSIGYLFALGTLSVFLVVVAGILTLVLSMMFNHILQYFLKLPSLSLPFVMVSTLIYLASYSYSNLYVIGQYAHPPVQYLSLPYWLDGYFTALGAILFSPNSIAGVLVAVAILLASRLLFLLSLMGFYVGATITGLMHGAMPYAFANINNFNFILIAMALGGVFLVPAPRSYLLAALAVATSTILLNAVQSFWATFGIPAFTLPFNVITLSFLYVLGLVGFPLVVTRLEKTPELSLDNYLTNRKRFAPHARVIGLPFTGEWQVWQGFDGQWTHRGNWRHAYDFVISRDDETFSGDGSKLTDYHAWNKPVLSPCRGRVVTMVDGLPDNEPGSTDSENNWGNLVIIETPALYYVEISHLAKDSIKVKQGDWLEEGALIGACGNSGYSPQPHIHVQVQLNAYIGAATLPFCFGGYSEQGEFHAIGLPAQGRSVSPLQAERKREFQLTFNLDQVLQFTATRPGRPDVTVELRVVMNELTETCFETSRGRLYFHKDKHSFYFYRLEGNDPWLAIMFAAMPRLPLVYDAKLHWRDVVPASAVYGRWLRALLLFVKAFRHEFGELVYSGRWQSAMVVSASLAGPGLRIEDVEVELDKRSGFHCIRFGENVLEKIDET